jgi:transcriptional regulator with XRE-family HTH domain
VEAKTILGANIRAHRVKRDWTQERLGEEAGLHMVEVGRVERGVKDIRLSTIVKFAGALEVPAAKLLKGI